VLEVANAGGVNIVLHDCDNLVKQLKGVHAATYGHSSHVDMKVLADMQVEILPVL
jgi:hypothetical protein